jgi:hypothetical protein
MLKHKNMVNDPLSLKNHLFAYLRLDMHWIPPPLLRPICSLTIMLGNTLLGHYSHSICVPMTVCPLLNYSLVGGGGGLGGGGGGGGGGPG